MLHSAWILLISVHQAEALEPSEHVPLLSSMVLLLYLCALVLLHTASSNESGHHAAQIYLGSSSEVGQSRGLLLNLFGGLVKTRGTTV